MASLMISGDIFKISNETNIENWYEFLKDHTMETRFLPISMELARAIINEYEGKGNSTPEDKSLLNELESELDSTLESFKSSGAFVRLSTRSPKDSRRAREKSQEIFDTEFKKGTGDENSRLIALVRASIQGLKVASGKEAMELLLDSERVHDDLLTALDHPQEFSQKIIVREWIHIPIDMEFRAFVHKKHLNALSQYYSYCFFPDLLKSKPEIAEKIEKSFGAIKDLIPLESYIIDFAVVKDQVIVIELNPFFLGTDPCLFSWKTDRKIFKKGPFEFRIRTEPVKKKAYL